MSTAIELHAEAIAQAGIEAHRARVIEAVVHNLRRRQPLALRSEGFLPLTFEDLAWVIWWASHRVRCPASPEGHLIALDTRHTLPRRDLFMALCTRCEKPVVGESEPKEAPMDNS